MVLPLSLFSIRFPTKYISWVQFIGIAPAYMGHEAFVCRILHENVILYSEIEVVFSAFSFIKLWTNQY